MRSQSARDENEAAWDEEDHDRPGWGSFVMRKLAGNPKQGIAVALALAAATAVIVNALFLQSGPHPAPIFATHLAPPSPSPRAGDSTGSVVAMLPRPRPAELYGARADAQPTQPAQPATKPPVRTAAAGAATVPHDDPIALLLAPSKRVLAVQRALAEYGYGQISPTGIEDPATAAAIRKFERERKLPVTGNISDRLVRELASVTGRPLD